VCVCEQLALGHYIAVERRESNSQPLESQANALSFNHCITRLNYIRVSHPKYAEVLSAKGLAQLADKLAVKMKQIPQSLTKRSTHKDIDFIQFSSMSACITCTYSWPNKPNLRQGQSLRRKMVRWS